MGQIKVLLIGVSKSINGHSDLPLCKNDILKLKKSLKNGLKVDDSNISVCGKNGRIDKTDLIFSLKKIIQEISDEDTFIFYFSGHGGKGVLALSDCLISTQEIIDFIEKIQAKNKIIILDSCHSGAFSISEIAIQETVEEFVGKGYAVMASCGADETSGFDKNESMSLYTRFVCDAISSSTIIRKGKKSLESINQLVTRFAELWNKKHPDKIQNPIFRSNIGGTIYFDIDSYIPYQNKKIYEETDDYIIYDVEPCHQISAKRYAIKVILKHYCTNYQIADIASEIQKKAMEYESYYNKISEQRFYKKSPNIIWCYFGYDIDDMKLGQFLCRTTWVDESQDKDYWYKSNKNSVLIKDIHIEFYTFYKLLKEIQDIKIGKDELIKTTREYTKKLITLAEKHRSFFQEYLNNTLTETQLVNEFININDSIENLFFLQSDLPIPQSDIIDWAREHANLACIIHNFSLYYNKKYIDKWSSEQRKFLMKRTILDYEQALEKLKIIDQGI